MVRIQFFAEGLNSPSPSGSVHRRLYGDWFRNGIFPSSGPRRPGRWGEPLDLRVFEVAENAGVVRIVPRPRESHVLANAAFWSDPGASDVLRCPHEN